MVEKTHVAGFWPQLYEPLRNFGARVADWLAPASDASSNEDAYRITMELPGVEEKDIELSVHDGAVTVTGEKSATREEKGETWFFSERQYGRFSRSFRLPPDADGDKVEADLKDGVLSVTIPRRNEAPAEGRRVEIRRG
ncbi:glutamyl-tRNA amidotransferase [Roseovarius sp. A46]|jgi:HSP20 family protein|uniref:Hsp20/alpha crystallin family protein n=1 Tax=Roseovarius sp. A46 TaxID=2109331 RepID=UPI000E822674|nr:Hsp20/alpha crystallin family protein [Roseovarius sp. A46]RXV60752.1 glutamyl-tRNA amidotransferase [Roseovarius sp. A46]HAW47324.1 glutamyl-tRNA amidotransferase [Roseovarius sp.]|tara:strand:- start:46 stop:462 length:417 start_codon:yes stop_codon:yes gene_type:complete